MSLKQPVYKEPLNKITHSIRAQQAVLQYGVGAMIDFPDQTLMTAAPEYWESSVYEVHDERLQKLLDVDYFGIPTGISDVPPFSEGISYVRFPEWYFCPKCRKFQPLRKWIDEYKTDAESKRLKNDPEMVKYIKCIKCNQDLVVSRIIIVCSHGHIDDFPWVEWAHIKNLGGSKQICDNPSLTFQTGSSSSEGLEGLEIKCENCNAKATLRDAFRKNIFSELEKETQKGMFVCKGKHPWKNIKESCLQFPKTMQRGSSSVYFPVTVSSLVIPPYSNLINKKIENSKAYSDIRSIFKMVDKNQRLDIIKKNILNWSEKIGNEIAIKYSVIQKILERKWFQHSPENYSSMKVKYRAEEYAALTGEVQMKNNSLGDFLQSIQSVEEYNLPFINKISLVHKVREIQAMVGYSRLVPIEWTSKILDVTEFVPIKTSACNWYPAYEVRGEGIFIEIKQDSINRWVDGNKDLTKRIKLINDNYSESFIGKSKPRDITAKFLLLHTLSHLLIKQLSFECGYNIASLKERIFCSEAQEGKEMAGLLIYTASGDSEGTLGGLVRQAKPDYFNNIFYRAIRSALACSNDPVCIISKGQGRESLNLAACHTCVLIPETCCEEYNILLDRAIIVGTIDNKDLGYFNEFLYEQKTSKASIANDSLNVNSS